MLRDLVGNSESTQKAYYVHIAMGANGDLLQNLIELLTVIKNEQICIVSYGYLDGRSPSFGSFISNKIVNFNQFDKIPIVPDAALLHFVLARVVKNYSF